MALIHGLELILLLPHHNSTWTSNNKPQCKLTESAAVSVGQINAGVRSNVIPEELTMTGTIRSLDGKVRHVTRQNKTSCYFNC
jgi:metal-dependent amidase/aminoacylase/carboxypeptidase family protein